MDLYWFALPCIEETERETDLSRQLREQGGTSGAVQKERTFGLSIERFWHYWRLKQSRHGIPDFYAEEAWRLCAIVREACEEAQTSHRDNVWAKRREKRRRERLEAEAKLRASGAPLPPQLIEPPEE